MKNSLLIRSWLLLFSLLVSSHTFATSHSEFTTQQQTKITGTITVDGMLMTGVSISVSGKQISTVSGEDGKYAIDAEASDILIFSYIGFTTVSEPVNGRSTINISLKEDATALQEITVNAGYYSVKEKERTGSIAKIKAADIEKQPVSNPIAAMQGRMSGVNITQSTGTPGGGFSIQIRGLNSLRGQGNDPMYIIDGVPFASQSLGTISLSNAVLPGLPSPLNSINPTDIESIEVLKDADATAIYGSRGANGVVLINTKKGKAGKTKFSVQTIRYVIIVDECRIEKAEDILIPYIVKLGVEVSCGTGNQYTVKLSDRSLYATGIAATSWIFKINGVVQPMTGPDNAYDRTVLLDADQTYTFSLTISDGVNESCTDVIVFPLRKIPDASFTFTDNVCQYTATKFTSVDQPNVTYSWDFGDSSFNLQQNPEREYSFGQKTAKLTVTDQYNCSRFSSQLVTTKQNNQFGEIATPDISCPGGSVNLHFDTDLSSIPVTSIQWLLDNAILLGAVGNDYAATISGQYSAIIGNSFGCSHQIAQSVPVAIATMPVAAIYGPDVACYDQPLRLYVSPGQGNSYTYNWYRDDQPGISLSTTYEMSDIPPQTFSFYNYAVDVTFTLANSATCSYTLSHGVSMLGMPSFTELSGTVTSCKPYTVVLKAVADTSGGTYNWSDGQEGTMVNQNQGGIYEVTYTSPGGCKIMGSVTVPKNPENFMWIFPYGCYEMCAPLTDGALIGPDVVKFEDWQWIKNSTTMQQGVDNVPAYSLSASSAIYNLSLTTGSCSLVSENMKIVELDCKDCKIDATLVDSGVAYEPYFHYTMTIQIFNTDPLNSISVQLTVPNNVGVITPGSVIVPPGGGIFTIWFVPDPLYLGWNFELTLRSNEGKPCIGFVKNLYFGESRMNDLANSDDNSKMVLYPNPAKENAHVDFDFGDISLTENLELIVYDLYGRILQQQKPRQKNGVWTIHSGQFSSGNFVVVMKLNGKILKQKILVVID
jgi:TonB-dependent SusC/RagA subfamily outer membrane receptor